MELKAPKQLGSASELVTLDISVFRLWALSSRSLGHTKVKESIISWKNKKVTKKN